MKQFDIILADPPWSYRVWSGKKSRTADAHYDVLPQSSIASQFPVGEIAARDSVLLLWSTPPCQSEAHATMAAWGFTYKTFAFVWVKINKDGSPYRGLGHYTRANAEPVLIGVRGNGVKRVRKDISQIVLAPRRSLPGTQEKHSVKPYEVQERIEQLYGDGVSRVELFARQERPGWVCWGDELDNGVELFK